MKTQSPFELRPYQVEIASKAAGLLSEKGIVYLSMECRTGKTITALETCRLYGAKSVLFLTKLKAIDSVESDAGNFDFDVTICNDESMHKIERKDFDVVIHDEHHRCFLGNTNIDGVEIKNIKVGSFQKSYNFTKNKQELKKVKNLFKNKLEEDLVIIKYNGKEIVCTENHEIFTKNGWKKAKDILPGDELQMV